jgi:PIN domain nuclease of toxin-antitoxin system
VTRPLLLDTCAAIWLAEDAPLSEAAIEALDAAADRGEKLYVSPWVAWEIGLLTARGKLSLILSPQQWFRRLLAVPLVTLADLNADILIASSFLPADSLRDPADKIMVATAREQGLTLMTRDRMILDYAAKGHVSALAC